MKFRPSTSIFLHAALLLFCITVWTFLVTSLSLSRTSPLTMSRAWVAVCLSTEAVWLCWCLLLVLALIRLASLSLNNGLWLTATSCIPLALSAPFLASIYVSDPAFHFLFTYQIPKNLVIWTPATVAIISQVALLVRYVSHLKLFESWLKKRFATHALLFVAFACLYVFTAGGHLYSPDESTMFFVTQNIVERGSVTIPRDEYAIAAGQPPFWYSKYGLIPSLLAVPPYWLSKLLGIEAAPPSIAFPIPNGAPPLIGLLVNPLITACTCVVLYATLRAIGFRSITSLTVTASYGIASSAWVYSKTFFSQSPAALFLLVATYLLIQFKQPRNRHYILAGVSMGIAAGCRAEWVILSAPLIINLFYSTQKNRGYSYRLIVYYIVSFMITTYLTVGSYNYVKTGSVFLTGHGSQGTLAGFSSEPYIGIFGSLFSSGFGLFLYNPTALIGVCYLPILARRNRSIAYSIGGLFFLSLAFYGSFGDWFGGFTWANRYFVVLLPLLAIPVAELLELPLRNPASLAFFACASILGFFINLLAVLFDFNNGWLDLWGHRANLDLIIWNPNYSPIVAHLRLLNEFLYTGAKLDLFLFWKYGVPCLILFLLLLTILTTLTVRSAVLADKSTTHPSL